MSVVVLAALLLTGASAAAPPAELIFSCRVRGGKTVTVTGDGGRLVYRYGTARRPELTIVGTAADGNVFKRIAVHGGAWDTQLRFVNGAYSYVVHSFPRSDIADNVATSGLMVFRGGKKILDRDCAPWAEMSLSDPETYERLETIPDSPEGAPSAWD